MPLSREAWLNIHMQTSDLLFVDPVKTVHYLDQILVEHYMAKRMWTPDHPYAPILKQLTLTHSHAGHLSFSTTSLANYGPCIVYKGIVIKKQVWAS